MKRSGFTLMELLVVLGLIALLAALLLPVFIRVREKGRETACLSNERQLGLAFHLYSQDSDDYPPRGEDAWASALYPYVENVSVFHCPTDATSDLPPYYPVSYGINSNIWYIIVRGEHHFMVPHATVDISPRTILLFEVSQDAAQITTPDEGWEVTGAAPRATSVFGNGGGLQLVGISMMSGVKFDINENVRYATGPLRPCAAAASDSCNAYNNQDPGRHSGGSNFLFADTHAQWLAPQKVSSGDDALAPGDAADNSNGMDTAAGSDNVQFAATFSTK